MDASINELANMTGRDRRTVARRLESLPSKPGANRAKLYDTRAALQRIIAPTGADGEQLDPAQEKAALDRARRELVELDVQRRRRDLVEVEAVISAWSTQVQIAKSRMMALPARLAPDMVRATDQREAERHIRREINAVLEELARVDGTPADSGEQPPQDAPAPA